MDYFAALRLLYRPTRAADLPRTLESMRRLMAALDDPQRRFPSVVVAGSTGKGTTCLRLAQGWRAAGLRVGLYTGPHLHLFRERFVIDGAYIPHDEFIAYAQMIEGAAQSVGAAPSTFEAATALALCWFARRGVDLAVLEVGLGGRFDAVNIAPNQLALITPLELEHAAMLGGSLASIAWHKAGIIQPGGVAITVPQPPVALAALQAEAAQVGAALLPAADEYALVTAARESLAGRGIAPPVPAGAAFDAALPGRLEWLKVDERAVLIDGGHTALAAARLRETLTQRLTAGAPARVVVGMLADKDAAAYLAALDAPAFHLVLTHAPGQRAAAPDALAAAFSPTQARVEIIPDLTDALASIHDAAETVCAVAGSLRMAAAAREAFGLLAPADLEEAALTRAIFTPLAK